MAKTPESVPVPWHTSNSALALALDRCGARLIQIVNYYDPAAIRRIVAQGLTVRQAWKRPERDGGPIPGKIVYIFEKNDHLNNLLNAWDEQSALLKTAAETTFEEDISAETAMRIMCIALKGRRDFNQLWEQETPRILIPGDGAPEVTKDEKGKALDEDGNEVEYTVEKVISYPGFKLLSIDMDPESLAAVEVNI